MFRIITGLGKKPPTLKELIRQGWNEIPEVLGAAFLGCVGLGIGVWTIRKYKKMNGEHTRFRRYYVVYRPDDPNIKYIKDAGTGCVKP